MQYQNFYFYVTLFINVTQYHLIRNFKTFYLCTNGKSTERKKKVIIRGIKKIIGRKIRKKRILKLRIQHSNFILIYLHIRWEFTRLLFCFYSFTLILYLPLQFHWLSAAVHITSTAYRAAIVRALIYYFKLKPAYLTNKSLASPQFIAVHFISPNFPDRKNM